MSKKLSCGLILINDNKILLGHVTKKNFWDIPKGEVENNESHIECCLRELKEETNLDYQSLRKDFIELGLFNYNSNKDLYLYKIEHNIQELKKLCCNSYFDMNGIKMPEMDEYKMVSFDEIDKFVKSQMSFILHKILKIPLGEKQKQLVRRTICYELRHNLENPNDLWMDFEQLRKKSIESNPLLSVLDISDFMKIINNDNDRFSIEGNKVKCNYGHAKNVISESYPPIKPPDILYHVTFSCFIEDIKKTGLKSIRRKYVFLATTEEKASSYKGKSSSYFFKKENGPSSSMLLKINSKKAFEDGIKFFKISDEIIGVEETIPLKYIENINNFIIADNNMTKYFSKCN